MKIVEGKCYFDRNHRLTGAMQNNGTELWPFFDPLTGNTFTADGFRYGPDDPNEMDLVEEFDPAVHAVIFNDRRYKTAKSCLLAMIQADDPQSLTFCSVSTAARAIALADSLFAELEKSPPPAPARRHSSTTR